MIDDWLMIDWWLNYDWLMIDWWLVDDWFKDGGLINDRGFNVWWFIDDWFMVD